METGHDRRALNEMARQLAGEDPQFVELLARLTPAAPRHGEQGPAVLLSVALVAVLACAVLLLPIATVASAALAVGVLGYVLLVRARPRVTP